MSERQYAAHVGLSRGAIQKAKAAGRLVLHEDGSIDATASDRLRAEATDPSKTRKTAAPKLKPVPEAAVSAVGDTLKEQGLAAPATGGGTTFLQAKTAHEVLKAQERRIRLAKLKGELVDRDRATALVFRLRGDGLRLRRRALRRSFGARRLRPRGDQPRTIRAIRAAFATPDSAAIAAFGPMLTTPTLPSVNRDPARHPSRRLPKRRRGTAAQGQSR